MARFFWIVVVMFLTVVTVKADRDSDKTKKIAGIEAVQVAPPAAEITGYYSVKGTEDVDKHYTGMACVTKVGNVYVVNWLCGHGANFVGIGIRDGNSLSVSWSLGNVKGINVYKIEPNRLVGKCAIMPGNGEYRPETLTFVKALEKEDGN
jgi:hypothetical protein